MFRLIKLVGYMMLGYFLYEFFVGLTQESSLARSRGGNQSRGGTSRPGGQSVETQESDGGATRHVVGRGVVNR